MNVLLDTNGWIGFFSGDPKYSSKAKECLLDEKTKVRVSIASVWEASIKVGLGKLKLPYDLKCDLPRLFEDNDFEVMPVSMWQATTVKDLEAIHGDPFDRIQVVQALQLKLEVISSDTVFDRYGVKRIW